MHQAQKKRKRKTLIDGLDQQPNHQHTTVHNKYNANLHYKFVHDNLHLQGRQYKVCTTDTNGPGNRRYNIPTSTSCGLFAALLSKILSLLWRAFLKLFYLFLHFVLLVYSFLIHVIGFSKQICFQSFLKLVKIFTVFNYHRSNFE